jgi:type 1 glutamine amidotransferase
MTLNRREMLLATGAGLLVPEAFARAAAQDKGPTKKVLFFTKSSGFPHPVVNGKNGELSVAERILTDVGKENGFEVVASKDGRLFDPDKIGQWDAFAFETTGDLNQPGTDKTPPISAEGEKAFYEAIKSGKGFIGMHCATDTFGKHRGQGKDDPYIQMIGGEFAGHGAQQKVKITVSDPSFPGANGFGTDSFEIEDEWYALRHLANDLHVIYVQNTMGMKGPMYDRPNYPETWARMHGKGRVFYTSMGHREDVWQNANYQKLLIGALRWVTGQADVDVTANVEKVTPGYEKLPGA